MRLNSGGFFMLLLVVAAVLLINTNVDCKATAEKIEEEAAESEGGSESWAEWAKNKLSEGLSFKAADDQETSKTNQLTKDEAGCAKDKACELKERAAEAYEEAKDKVVEKVSDIGEESKKREAEAEDTLNWVKEKAKEGYEAAKSKAEETYESGKDKLSHHQEL